MAGPSIPPNSYKYKEEQAAVTEKKEIKKVVNSTATTRKKSELSKFADKFIAEDASNIKSYIVDDLVVPTLKKLVSNIIIDTVETILGTGERRRGGGRDSDRPYVSYRSYSDRDHRDSHRDDRPSIRFDYDVIEYPSRGDAEAVLDEMYAAVKKYGLVTVAEMYDMSGLVAPYTAHNYGWTSVRNAEVRRSGGKYIISLPKPYPID